MIRGLGLAVFEGTAMAGPMEAESSGDEVAETAVAGNVQKEIRNPFSAFQQNVQGSLVRIAPTCLLFCFWIDWS